MKRNARDQRHLVAVDRPDPEPDGQPNEQGPMTVAVYLEEWLWGKQSLRPSTRVSYEAHVRLYFVPHLGTLALSELTPRHIERMYRALATDEDCPLSVPTLRRIHGTLMSALNLAVRRGLIERNPAATVELPRAPSRKTATWSAQELSRFLDAVHEDRLHPLFLLLGLVGMRRGEALALRWVDVDLNAGLLRIEQSLVRVGDRSVMGPPKSVAGTRVVAIDDETTRRLHWHQCRQRLEVLRLSGVPQHPDLVFTTPDGEALDPAYVSRHFNRLVARHGLRRIRLHDLRHSSASIGLASGESLVEVSRRLGHSSIVITADVYSHLSSVVAKESAERRAKAVFPTP